MTPIRQGLIWGLVRVLVLFELLLPDAEGIPSDLVLFASWRTDLSSGRLPTADAWQYPAGFAVLLGAAGAIGLGSVVGLASINLAADAGILWRLRGTVGGTFWAIAPLLVGPIMLGRMDSVVTLAAVLGVASASNSAVSGLWLGLGASIKLWPGLMLAVLPSPGALRRAVFAGIAFFSSLLLAWLAFGANPLVGNQTGRGLQLESVPAYPLLVARYLGAPVGIEFRNGAFEVVSSVANTVQGLLLPFTIGLVAAIAVASRRGRLGASDPGVALLTVIAVLLSSRVYSPQFNVWLLGLLALMLAKESVPRSVTATLSASALAAQLVYPYAYSSLMQGAAAGLLLQGTRITLLAAAGVILLRHLLASSHQQQFIDGTTSQQRQANRP